MVTTAANNAGDVWWNPPVYTTQADSLGGLGATSTPTPNWTVLSSTSTLGWPTQTQPSHPWMHADDVAMDENGNLLVRADSLGIKLVVPKALARRLMALIQMAELAGMLPEEVEK